MFVIQKDIPTAHEAEISCRLVGTVVTSIIDRFIQKHGVVTLHPGQTHMDHTATEPGASPVRTERITVPAGCSEMYSITSEGIQISLGATKEHIVQNLIFLYIGIILLPLEEKVVT